MYRVAVLLFGLLPITACNRPLGEHHHSGTERSYGETAGVAAQYDGDGPRAVSNSKNLSEKPVDSGVQVLLPGYHRLDFPERAKVHCIYINGTNFPGVNYYKTLLLNSGYSFPFEVVGGRECLITCNLPICRLAGSQYRAGGTRVTYSCTDLTFNTLAAERYPRSLRRTTRRATAADGSCRSRSRMDARG
jgi:hypothetical protein